MGVATEMVAVMFHVQKVPHSNLCLDIGCTDIFVVIFFCNPRHSGMAIADSFHFSNLLFADHYIKRRL
jgi:hypothetical protein